MLLFAVCLFSFTTETYERLHSSQDAQLLHSVDVVEFGLLLFFLFLFPVNLRFPLKFSVATNDTLHSRHNSPLTLQLSCWIARCRRMSWKIIFMKLTNGNRQFVRVRSSFSWRGRLLEFILGDTPRRKKTKHLSYRLLFIDRIGFECTFVSFSSRAYDQSMTFHTTHNVVSVWCCVQSVYFILRLAPSLHARIVDKLYENQEYQKWKEWKIVAAIQLISFFSLARWDNIHSLSRRRWTRRSVNFSCKEKKERLCLTGRERWATTI